MTEPAETQASMKMRILKIAVLNILVPGIGNIFLDSPRPLNILGFLLGIWATVHGIGLWLTVSAIMTLKAYIDVWLEPQRASRYIADAATPEFGKQSELSTHPHAVSDSVQNSAGGEFGFDRLAGVQDSDHLLRDHSKQHAGLASSPEQKSVHLPEHEPSGHRVSDPADAYFEQSLPVAHVSHPHWHPQSHLDSDAEHLSHGTAQPLTEHMEPKGSVPGVHKSGSPSFGNHDTQVSPHLSHGAAQSLSEFTQHNEKSHPHEHVEHPHLVNANKPIEPLENHTAERNSSLSSEQGEFGTIYDIYDDASSTADIASPVESGGKNEHVSSASENSAPHLLAVDQIGMTGIQSGFKHVELCPTCQKPREGRRPSCPACGTHFDTDND